MSDELEQTDGTAGRHQAARSLAEQALEAQAAGDDDEAERLFDEAERTDADATINVLQEHAADANDPSTDLRTSADALPQNDEEIAAMSRTIEPGAGAPSRANVGGSGSGADNQ